MTESDYSFFLVSHSDSSKGGAYILSENPRLEVARRCRLLLEIFGAAENVVSHSHPRRRLRHREWSSSASV